MILKPALGLVSTEPPPSKTLTPGAVEIVVGDDGHRRRAFLEPCEQCLRAHRQATVAVRRRRRSLRQRRTGRHRCQQCHQRSSSHGVMPPVASTWRGSLRHPDPPHSEYKNARSWRICCGVKPFNPSMTPNFLIAGPSCRKAASIASHARPSCSRKSQRWIPRVLCILMGVGHETVETQSFQRRRANLLHVVLECRYYYSVIVSNGLARIADL